MIVHVNRGGITREVAEKLLEAYRRSPGHARLAAKAASIDHRTARKAWERGWPHLPFASRPLREVIAEEQEAARALRDEQAGEVMKRVVEMQAAELAARRSRAQSDAATTRAAEAVLVKAGRSAAVSMAASLAKINAGLQRVSASVATRLQVPDAGPATVSELAETLALLGTFAGALRQAVASASIVIQMERTVAGEPRDFAAVPEAPPQMSLEEAERRVQAGLRALERAKAKGIDPTPAQ